MRKRLMPGMLVLAALIALAVAPAHALAAEAPVPRNNPSSGQLVERPKEFDGTTVTFTGEAIGEVMARGDYAWIHLNDDAYMVKNVEEGATLGGYNSGMAVWIPTALTKTIDTYGDYKHEGSIVTITGTFNAACKEHGGDMDIHATALVLVAAGHVVDDPIAPWKVLLAVALVAIAAALWWVDRRTRNRIAPHRGV